MYIIYNKYVFSEIFDKVRTIDSDVGILEYSVKKNDYVLYLYISPYDEYVTLTLEKETEQRYIFDISLKNAQRIQVEKKEANNVIIHFFKDESPEALSVLDLHIEPNIALSHFSI